jgi:hypothetical protein
MPKRSSGSSNLDQRVTGRAAPPRKNPHAAALGRLGGPKGGAARAKNLSKKRLSEIGRMGARARWGK